MTKLTANRNRKEFFLNVTVNARIYLNLFKSDRFVIFGNDDDDTVVTLEDEMVKEGEMIGAEVSLNVLEQKAEQKSGWLFVKVFIEKVEIYM